MVGCMEIVAFTSLREHLKNNKPVIYPYNLKSRNDTGLETSLLKSHLGKESVDLPLHVCIVLTSRPSHPYY